MFVKQFNDKTNNPDMKGLMLPVVITVYSDRSFEFKIKSPPAAVLIKLAAKIPAGKKQGKEVIPADAKKGGKYKGFTLTKKQVEEIAKKKLTDLNARDVEHAARIIEGTARSMGITVSGLMSWFAKHGKRRFIRGRCQNAQWVDWNWQSAQSVIGWNVVW